MNRRNYTKRDRVLRKHHHPVEGERNISCNTVGSPRILNHPASSNRSREEESISDEVYTELLGGKGLDTDLLLNSTRAGFEPLFEEKLSLNITITSKSSLC